MFGRNGRRRRARRSRALTTAAALAGVIALTAGCATLGASGAGTAASAGGQRPATATAPAVAGATGAKASAAATASRSTATRMPSSGPASATATAARMPSATSASSSTSAPAASEPPPSGAAGSRLVTFVNQMQETIWVAAAPNPSTPLAATGWVLPAGHSVTISTPNNLNTRFWGRTGCVFNRQGVGHCQTGDCGGLFQCKGWGTIPATLAEVNFDAWDNLDFYDVSMVDGSNLPMYINVSGGSATNKVSSDGCVKAGCTKAVQCPKVLDVKAGGKVVGCISACARLGGDQYCCRGPYAPRADCNPAKWPVNYAAVFKRAEPYAYSYVDDDATSVYVCKGRCNYRIVFGLTPTKKK
jgi:Thaumatin family